MKSPVEDMPVVFETPIGGIRQLDEARMTFTLIRVTAHVDLAPLFAGLPGGLCPVPHWGYVIEGAVHARFEDGHEETVEKGSVFHFTAGHVRSFDAGTSVIEIGPRRVNEELREYLQSLPQGLSAA
jgi:hypothetical protein